jgi:hypothetical protein
LTYPYTTAPTSNLCTSWWWHTSPQLDPTYGSTWTWTCNGSGNPLWSPTNCSASIPRYWSCWSATYTCAAWSYLISGYNQSSYAIVWGCVTTPQYASYIWNINNITANCIVSTDCGSANGSWWLISAPTTNLCHTWVSYVWTPSVVTYNSSTKIYSWTCSQYSAVGNYTMSMNCSASHQ